MSQAFHMVPPMPHDHAAIPPGMEVTMLLGAAAVGLMFLCRSHQHRAPGWIIGTIVFGFMAGVYGFSIGAWPLGIAEIVYAVLAYRSWLQSRRRTRTRRRVFYEDQPRIVNELHEESRMSRLFGSH